MKTIIIFITNTTTVTKVKQAQDCGAKGAILYNDPADNALEGQDKVYPQYIWLPKTGVESGSIFNGRGDPLTPGLPSVDGIFRIPEDKAVLPTIPATPMPYGDVVEILKIMRGMFKADICNEFWFPPVVDCYSIYSN